MEYFHYVPELKYTHQSMDSGLFDHKLKDSIISIKMNFLGNNQKTMIMEAVVEQLPETGHFQITPFLP